MIAMAKRIVLRRDLPAVKPKRRRKAVNKVRNHVPEGKDRLNLQIDKDLKDFGQDYAKRHQTTLTQLFKDYLVALKKKEEGEGVEQI